MWEEATECFKEYRGICTALNLDKGTVDTAWANYANLKKNLTLEGDQKPWFGCSIYVACRNARVGTVGRGNVSIEGNLVNVSGLLRHCNLSVLEFFKKCKKWMEWTECTSKLRGRLDYLERKFTVSMVIFLKYRPIFVDIFREPVDSSPQHKSKKSRIQGCSSSKLFDFCWTLFLCLKSRVPIVAEDLVNSFHLLLATCDLVFANALLDNRRDLLNPDFPGLPDDFEESDYKASDSPPCIIDELCRRHCALSLEAAFAKTYCLKPQVTALMRSGTLQGVRGNTHTILQPQFFDANMKGLDSAYAEYVISVGDFDERIFLSDDASDDIGAKSERSEANQHNEKDSPPKAQTPLATVTSSVRLLMGLISGRSVGKPSETLLSKLMECSATLDHEISERVDAMGQKFIAASMVGQVQGHESTAFFKRRLEFASTLYYRVLENILAKEQTSDLMSLLQRDIIHQSIFACCLEIVLFSYNANRPFPWVLEALEVEPYYFYRVVEIIIRAEKTLSSNVVKHLTTIEKRVLECLAWRSRSPLWDQIRSHDGPIPKCEQVSFSNQLLHEEEMKQEPQPPTTASLQLADRYGSPVYRSVRTGQVTIQRNTNNSHIMSSTTDPPRRPARVGSLALFFRKFYFLANQRMEDLCTRLDIVDIGLKRKIWTCFEYSIVNNTELMRDRHLDQILMCALYVMCRILHTQDQPTNTQFTDILKVYRNQAQAESSVYRNVLLSQAESPEGDVREERGNLIQFYNNVYMHKIEAHAREYVVELRGDARDFPLSPLPRIRQPGVSPSRKFVDRIIINPLEVNPSIGNFDDITATSIFIHNSPAKDLAAINEKIIKVCNNKAVKRILGSSDDAVSPKKSNTLFLKLSNVIKDRSKQ